MYFQFLQRGGVEVGCEERDLYLTVSKLEINTVFSGEVYNKLARIMWTLSSNVFIPHLVLLDAEYLEFIYPRELEIKETTEAAASSSYLDCYLYIDNGKLTTRLYDKRNDFNFPIVNFPFLSNIPSAPAYGVYVSQLIRYARTCSNYQDFMERGKVLTTKLLSQGYQKTKLVATLKKFYGRHHDLVNPYNVAVSRIVSDVFASDAP